MNYCFFKKYFRGTTLIEVLIATLVLSGGFLAVARLHLLSVRHTQAAYLNSVAQSQLNNMAECLQLKRVGYHCQKEQAEWEEKVAKRLPQGIGKIFQQGAHLQVIVAWNDSWVGHLGKKCPRGISPELTCLVTELAL
ncbi:MAG: type IV pilus modification PilV family protein [Gammaproteobacteria bacterium]